MKAIKVGTILLVVSMLLSDTSAATEGRKKGAKKLVIDLSLVNNSDMVSVGKTATIFKNLFLPIIKEDTIVSRVRETRRHTNIEKLNEILEKKGWFLLCDDDHENLAPVQKSEKEFKDFLKEKNLDQVGKGLEGAPRVFFIGSDASVLDGLSLGEDAEETEEDSETEEYSSDEGESGSVFDYSSSEEEVDDSPAIKVCDDLRKTQVVQAGDSEKIQFAQIYDRKRGRCCNFIMKWTPIGWVILSSRWVWGKTCERYRRCAARA